MEWLMSQSVAVLVIGCVTSALLLALGSRAAASALVPAPERDGAYAIAAPLMPALGATFAILAALTLASEAGLLTSAQSIVSNEAADASRLAWAATTSGVQRRRLHEALRAYLQATRTHEWRGAAAGHGDDPATTIAIGSLERIVRAQTVHPSLGTPTSTELLSSLDALAVDRRARLAAASRTPPALYVITLLFSGIALIANAAALTVRSRLRVALLAGGLSAVVGLSMALLFALGTPSRGPIGVSGHPVDAVIRDLSRGYFHR